MIKFRELFRLRKHCFKHNIEYYYVCPQCLKPYLKKTKFNSLKEIRDYQIKMASLVIQKDKRTDIKTVGIIKNKVKGKMIWSGAFLYDLIKDNIYFRTFTSQKPIFTKYFSTVLFLNQVDNYIELINNIVDQPDCYLINASGRIHPFLFGLTCDIGLKIDIPIFGYTETLLYGRIVKKEESVLIDVYDDGEKIGLGIPKPNSKKFFFISIGNNLSLNTAKEIFMRITFETFSQIKIDLNNFIQKSMQ